LSNNGALEEVRVDEAVEWLGNTRSCKKCWKCGCQANLWRPIVVWKSEEAVGIGGMAEIPDDVTDLCVIPVGHCYLHGDKRRYNGLEESLREIGYDALCKNAKAVQVVTDG